MKHNSQQFWDIIDRAKAIGFRTVDKKNGILIIPPQNSKTQMPYLAHLTERALHPVRRYVKNQCGFSNFS